MRPFKAVSPSQISTFQACPRKWYFGTILGIRQPQTPNQELGERIHKCLENHYKGYGLDWEKPEPTALNAAKALLKLLPVDGEPEVKIDGTLTLAGIPVNGRLDLVVRDSLKVIDYKTISSISRYSKTSEHLKTDPQAIIYLAWLAQQMNCTEETCLRFHHAYVEPKTLKTSLVPVDLIRSEIDMAMGALGYVVETMRVEATKPAVSDVTANTDACNDYGGCYYRGQCPAQNWRATMGLLSDMMETKPEPKPETKPEPTCTAVSTQGILASDAKPGQEYDIGGDRGICRAKGCAGKWALFAGKDRVYQLPRDARVIPVGDTPTPTPAQAEKAERWAGPSKSEAEAPPMVISGRTDSSRPNVANAPKELPEMEPGMVTAMPATSPRTLYIGCTPMAECAVLDQRIVAEFEAMKKELGSDPRLSDAGPLAFGKWKVHLGKRLVEKVLPCYPGDCAVLTRGDVVSVAIEALMPHFARVIIAG